MVSIVNDSGHITNQTSYDYNLKEGICDQFIALDLLEEKGFNKKIIKDAKKIYKKLQK